MNTSVSTIFSKKCPNNPNELTIIPKLKKSKEFKSVEIFEIQPDEMAERMELLSELVDAKGNQISDFNNLD